MTSSTLPFPDLRDMAYRAMLDKGFSPDAPQTVIRELRALSAHHSVVDKSHVRDLRSRLWSSIDNEESRDLDQVEFAEREANGNIRIHVGIADVDAYVPKGSALDEFAFSSTTSVYTGVATFPMLPEQLSHDATSLIEAADRLAVVIELVVASDGEVRESDIYGAVVRNHAKLVYESVSEWLDGDASLPQRIANIPGLAAQLRLQAEAADWLRGLRERRGALNFDTIEARPVTVDNQIVALKVTEPTRAREIIESFMVAANSVAAAFLEAHGSPSIRRVVRAPERWPRIVELAAKFNERLPAEADSLALAEFLARRKAVDPLRFPDLSLAIVKLLGAGQYTVERAGANNDSSSNHFGLAAPDYAHSTAPNRRYSDLVMQRLLKAAVVGTVSPYSESALEQIAARCTERRQAANKIERLMRKVAAAVWLSDRIGTRFDAIVTGVSTKGTFVRLIAPPAEGRVVRGEEGLDVGDKVSVRLVATDATRGFIDFARAD